MATLFMPLVILLMAVSAWAEQQTVNRSGFVNNTDSSLKTEKIPVETHQEDGEIQKKNASISRADEMDLNVHRDLIDNIYVKDDSGCHTPFQSIGNGCYYFSDDSGVVHDFAGAQQYCDSISHAHILSKTTLAMLAFDTDDDLALLDAISKRGNVYWMGGNTLDSVTWNWVDDREVYLPAPFWFDNEPNEAENKCMIAQRYTNDNFVRAYIYDYQCDESLNFICQAQNINCPNEFRRIGNFCYFISEEVGGIPFTWQDSRDYCQSIAVPEGYHVDLAVLGLPDQGDIYHLMTDLVSGYEYINTWVGASGDSECRFDWIDGRTFLESNFYWYPIEPDCVSTELVFIYRPGSLHNRTFLYGHPESSVYPFICQMFKSNA
ncbi:unnamed protein product [Meganyctiphanes norvegica]|uniref:C-type lectin domain-containing protein n=1 Tax=Meganyctiphanes norvegica TaxID=48144 RepID=A0AAV2RJC0_MEGNR